MSSIGATSFVPVGAGTGDSSVFQEGQCRLVEVWTQVRNVPSYDCVFCVLLCPFLKGGEPLAAPAETLTFPAQTTKLQTMEDEDLTWRKMGGTETAIVSTFPFLVQWQIPNSYFQLVSGLPFPMSSKCPILLPTGLLSLEEGDVSQKRLYLDWGFVATPVHPFHLLADCLWRASSVQTWQGKSKAQSTWLTQAKGSTWQTAQVCDKHKAKGMVLLLWPEVSTDKWHLSNWTQTVCFLALNICLEKATVCN